MKLCESALLAGFGRCEMVFATVGTLACRAGCDRSLDLCVRCGLRALRDSGGPDWLRCAEHGERAAVCVYCGFCRKGSHDDCRAYRVGARRAMVGQSPAHPDEYCACTCELTDGLVPGARWARGRRPDDD